MVNTVAAPNRSPAPDESVADTTAAITKPAIIGGMRLSATVATALFASMFGNSANATRPNTAGTKANRAMIIPQMMEPRTASFFVLRGEVPLYGLLAGGEGHEVHDNKADDGFPTYLSEAELFRW